MSFRISRHTLSRTLIDRLLFGTAVGGAVLFLVAVTGGAWWTLSRIDQSVRVTARRSLISAALTAQEAADHWAARQQALALGLGATSELTTLVGKLESPRDGARAAVELAGYLDPTMRAQGLQGYWIIGGDGRVLFRSDAVAGAPSVDSVTQESVDRALDGLPTLSTIPGARGAPSRLAALAPIRDSRGQPVAALLIVLPAQRELQRIATENHSHSPGQTYFFDHHGRVTAASHLPLPADDRRLVPVSPQRIRTPMAEAMLARKGGVDLDGYPDERGVPVVAAWTWDEELGLGVGVEVDRAEAYHVVETARSALLAAVGLTLLLFMAVVLSLLQSRRGAMALSALQRRLAAVLESTTDPVCFADARGEPIYLNDAGRALLGDPRDARPTAPLRPELARVLLRDDALSHASGQGSWSGETAVLTGDGREITLSQVMLCHRRPDGAVDFYSTLARDITERKRLERRLGEEKERAEVTLGSIGDAVVRTDARGCIEYLNPVAEQLLALKTEQVAGEPINAVLAMVHETTREPLENPVETCLREGRVVGRANMSLLIRPDGREFAIDDSAAPIKDRDGEIIGAVLVFHDVSRARTLARQLAHQASHDFLTGLVNRHEFERRVGRALVRAQEEAANHALCFLDLDQFKVVNDTCGHVAGDELLRQLAGALQKKVRRRDTLARLGGDEFGVLLEHCPPGQATRVAQDLMETIQEFRFVWEGKPFALGVSVGVVPITAESESLAAVLRDADSACYAAKERGRNRVHFYEPNDAMMAVRQGEMQWVSRITQALEDNRFRLYGQPIVPLSPRPGERLRCEVLLRMVDHDGSLIAPGAFIPAAERYNLMGAVDRWVVRAVTAVYATYPAHGLPPIASINLSGASLLDPGMLAFVREQLTRHQLAPETLCFEITETAAIANLAQAAHFIRELKALGCWFALDDFGSGMSSFGYLQSLPVDQLKIAGAFLRHIESDPVEYAMVEAIHRVGHVMRLKTVAEGVEDPQTIETLRKIGVDYAQGFALGEPIPLEELLASSTGFQRGGPALRLSTNPAAGRRGPAIA